MSKSEDALLARVEAHCQALAETSALPFPVRDEATDALLATGLMGKTAALIPLILAAEAAEDTAKAVVRDTRALLLDVLNQTTGVVRSASHQAGVANGKASVIVTDEAALPAEMLRTSPDKAAIERALRAGVAVPGATLSNGGPPSLRITTLKGGGA